MLRGAACRSSPTVRLIDFSFHYFVVIDFVDGRSSLQMSSWIGITVN
jgi:hypothetical protein